MIGWRIARPKDLTCDDASNVGPPVKAHDDGACGLVWSIVCQPCGDQRVCRPSAYHRNVQEAVAELVVRARYQDDIPNNRDEHGKGCEARSLAEVIGEPYNRDQTDRTTVFF